MFGQNSTWGQNNQQQNTQQPSGGLFGGGGGFGQQQQQQNTGFGQTTGGFGQPAQQNTGGLFGGASTSTNTGFGFGANNNTTQNNAFGGGARPGFGASGSTFGQPTNTGGGLFGSSNTTTNTFGAQNTGNSLFGKPATTTSTFGGGQTSGLFGAKPANASPFGAQSGTNPNQLYQYTPGPFPPPPQTGTAAPPYQDTWQADPGTSKDMPAHLFHVITAMDPYKGASFEELRAMDYQQGRKDAGASAAAGTNAFGATTGGFGQPAASTSTFGQPAANSTFGAAKPGGLFGGGTTGTTGFGQTSTGFGATNNTTGGLFGSQPQQQQSSPFGGATTNTTGGLFGQTQQQPAATGGLFGNTSTTFGQNNQQQQAGSTFGGFGANKPFGATSTATTGFGQPAAGASTFGQPAQNTGTTGFGGFGQTQQQPQQQQTGGLFGGGFGQTNNQPATGGLFGQNNQQQQQPATGGLFGSTAPKPGGLFGSTTTNNAAAPTSTFSFGQNNTQQPAAGGSSLFGNTATQPSTGLFGQTNQQQQQPAQTGGLFGNTSTTGGGLFGAKPATTAPGTGLFGAQPAQQPAQTGGLFGNTASQPTNSLFGGGTNTFGQQNQQNTAKPAGTGLFGGGSLFGNNNQQPQQQASTGGLFGSTLGQSQPASGGLFGSTAQQPQAPLGGSLFGSTLGQSTAAQPQQPTLTASLDQNPYGNSALFAYNGQKLDYNLSTKKAALPPLTSSSFNLTPRKSTNKLRGFASPLAESLSISRSQSPGLSSPRRAYGSPAGADRYKGLTDAALTPNAFVPRPSVKKLTITPKNSSLFSSEDHLEAVLGKSALRSTPSRNGNAPASPAPPVPQPPPSQSPTAAKTAPAANGHAPNSTPARPPPPPSKAPEPKKGDYWCRPKLDRLKQMTPKELSAAENFSAGRTGYGEVSFQTPVDLTGLDLDTFLGEALVFSDMELAVYPEDYPSKAPQGKGLNVPAQITLENCFPKDKATKQPITDNSDPRHVKFLKRVKSVPDTEFVGYTNDGQWTFKVQHFSKYGLRDSDDESDPGATATDVAKAKAREAHTQDMVPSDEEQGDEYDDEDESEEDMLPTKSMYDIPEEHDSGVEDDSAAEESMGEESTATTSSGSTSVAEEPPRQIWNPAAPLTSRLGAAGMRNVREMQAGFFGDTPRKRKLDGDRGVAAAVERAKRIQPQAGFDNAEGRNDAAERAISGISFGEKSGPSRKLVPRKYAKVPLADSFVHQHEGIRADAGLALGRSFRCSWGPNGQLVHSGKICAPSTVFASAPQATVYVQQVDLLSELATSENPRANRLLTLHLRRTRIDTDEDNIPRANIDDTIRFGDFSKLFEGADRGHEASIFRLGQALFDEIDLRLPADSPAEIAERVMDVRRKLALSKWLEDAVSPAVDHDLVKTNSRSSQIFGLLSGNQLSRAVTSALEGGDMRLATLLSQAGGPASFRAQVQKQLDEWKKYKASAQISVEYRRLYALLAGITDLLPGDASRGVDHAPDVKIADGLDWKRAFGLRLWYGNPFEDTIAEVLAAYSDSLSSTTPPAPPVPPYLEVRGSKNGWNTPNRPTDILYNLLRLYADGGISLDQSLHARDISPSPTDYRILWHLYMLLHRVLRVRDFEDRDVETFYSATADAVTVSYASQLEEAGEWRWAAFVLLHLETPGGRRSAIKALLHRHPDPTEEDIKHLTQVLHIPPTWIHEARADQLASQGRLYEEYHALIRAESFDRAHRLLASHLAPEAVLRGDLALVRKLCVGLDGKPSGWETGGKLFLDYANVLDASVKLRSAFDSGSDAPTRDLARTVPRLLQLLPSLFPNQNDLQQVATLSDMLSALQKLAAGLHNAGLISRPPVSSALVDVDRLHLLQNAAFDGFTKALDAVSSSA